MKRLRISLSLAFLLVVSGTLSLSSCGDDGGLFTEIDTGVTAGDIAGTATNICGSGSCDGVLEDSAGIVSKGEDADDFQAMFTMFTQALSFGTSEEFILGTLNALAEEGTLVIPPGTSQRALTTGRDTIPCDEGDMTITGSVNFVLTEEEILFEEGFTFTSVLAFHNCLLEADFLATEDFDQWVLFNGSMTLVWQIPAMEEPLGTSASDPYIQQITGNVSMQTDLNEDEDDDPSTAPETFWATPLITNAIYFDDGDEDYYNGGVCAGAGIAFGPDGDDASDDECAPDGDSGDEAFTPAYFFLGGPG
ncbi:MAG: hypothetical protein AB1405_03245 [Bdellovibrionota bacterium]